MSTVPSLFNLCAAVCRQDPGTMTQLQDWHDEKWISYHKKTSLEALQEYTQGVGHGKKFVLLAQMGVVDPRKIIWWNPTPKETKQEIKLAKQQAKEATTIYESFLHASLLLTYSIFSNKKSLEEKQSVITNLSQDNIENIRQLAEDEIRKRQVFFSGDFRVSAEKFYGLKPLN